MSLQQRHGNCSASHQQGRRSTGQPSFGVFNIRLSCHFLSISCPLPVSPSAPVWLFSQVLQSRGPVCVDRHSQSLDDVRLFPPPTPLGSTLPPDASLSCTFGLPDPQGNPRSPSSAAPVSYYPAMHCQAKPSFYGRRAPNCLSLDLLGEEQLLEFIL